MTQNKNKILVIESEGKMTLYICHYQQKSEHFIETFVTIIWYNQHKQHTLYIDK